MAGWQSPGVWTAGAGSRAGGSSHPQGTQPPPAKGDSAPSLSKSAHSFKNNKNKVIKVHSNK